MKKILVEFENQIDKLSTKDIADKAGVKVNMAQKYKRFENYPSLPKATLLEDAYNIPARIWADIKNFKDAQK